MKANEENNKHRKKALIIAVIGAILIIVLLIISCVWETGIKKIKSVLDISYNIAMIFSIVSIWIAYSNFKGEHEKGRREKAIDLIASWNSNISENTVLVKDFLEGLSEEQCRRIARLEPINILREDFRKIEGFLNREEKGNKTNCEKDRATDESKKIPSPVEDTNKECEYITLDRNDVKKIRFEAVRYLNMLETIMLVWKDNVADNAMIEQEFSFLLDACEGKTVLANMRNALNPKNYPCIELFCIRMEEKRRSEISNSKPKL